MKGLKPVQEERGSEKERRNQGAGHAMAGCHMLAVSAHLFSRP